MRKSTVWFCSVLTALCMLALAALLFLAPRLTAWYVSWRGMQGNIYTSILVAFYASATPSGLALSCLLRLLVNIRKEKMFEKPNSQLMSVVSWCCMAVAVITGAAAYWYLPMALLTAAMLFIFLIVRIVRGCFVTAIQLKEESSLTI